MTYSMLYGGAVALALTVFPPLAQAHVEVSPDLRAAAGPGVGPVLPEGRAEARTMTPVWRSAAFEVGDGFGDGPSDDPEGGATDGQDDGSDDPQGDAPAQADPTPTSDSAPALGTDPAPQDPGPSGAPRASFGDEDRGEDDRDEPRRRPAGASVSKEGCAVLRLNGKLAYDCTHRVIAAPAGAITSKEGNQVTD
ncbi:MAG: hypothetical protein AAFR93_13845 [Pseudomonadota bacterium]